VRECCGGCWRCCYDCNHDSHYCHGCGVPVEHGDQGVCEECHVAADIEEATDDFAEYLKGEADHG
jgi:hypothetical protein